MPASKSTWHHCRESTSLRRHPLQYMNVATGLHAFGQIREDRVKRIRLKEIRPRILQAHTGQGWELPQQPRVVRHHEPGADQAELIPHGRR